MSGFVGYSCEEKVITVIAFVGVDSAGPANAVHSSCSECYTHIHVLLRPRHNKRCLILSITGHINANASHQLWYADKINI